MAINESVREASGRGRLNFQLVNNVIGRARLTYNTAGVTVTNTNHAIGTAAFASSAGSFVLTWEAGKYSTVPPNVHINLSPVASNGAAVYNCAVASNNVSISIRNLSGALTTATAGLVWNVLTGAQTVAGGINIFPVAATGTSF